MPVLLKDIFCNGNAQTFLAGLKAPQNWLCLSAIYRTRQLENIQKAYE